MRHPLRSTVSFIRRERGLIYKFTRALVKGTDSSSQLPIFGFQLNGKFVSNPFLSADGLSAADPVVDYGVTRKEAEDLQALNALLDIATQAAINHGCLAVQESLDLGCGDVAGMHFAVPERVRPVAQAMIEYIGSELALTFGQEFRT